MKAQAKLLGSVHEKISHMLAANDLARLHICAVSPEPSLIALKDGTQAKLFIPVM